MLKAKKSECIVVENAPLGIESAKNAAIDFIDSIPSGSYIGVVSFAGATFVKQKLTDNYFEAKEALKEVSSIPVGGTDIGSAIISSANLLMSSNQAKAVILLTDGRDNVGVSTLDAVDYANENVISVYTIGVGTEEGGIIQEASNVKLSLDEETLTDIADKTDAKYFRARSSEELKSAYKEIASTSKRKVSVDLTLWLVFIALFALIIDWVLLNTRYRTLP